MSSGSKSFHWSFHTRASCIQIRVLSTAMTNTKVGRTSYEPFSLVYILVEQIIIIDVILLNNVQTAMKLSSDELSRRDDGSFKLELIMNPLHESNAGSYMCLSRNNYGYNLESMHLFVKLSKMLLIYLNK